MTLIRYKQPTMAFGLGRFDNPWSSFEEEMDRMMNAAFSGFFSDLTAGSAFSHPQADLYEDDDNYHARIELPGLKRDDIHVELGDGVLTLSGERKSFGADGEATESSRFTRSLSVPARVQEDKVTARYEDGVLTVTLPKAEEVKPKRIAVQVK